MGNGLSIVERSFDVRRSMPSDQWGRTVARVGSQRAGKNGAEILESVEWAQRRIGPQFHFYPEKNENAPKLANHLHANGCGDEVIINSLDDPDQSLEECLIAASTHPDPIQRAIEDCNTEEVFMETSLESRGDKSDTHPFLQEALIQTPRLILRQPQRVRVFKSLRCIGKFHSRDFRKLLDDVQNDDCYYFFRELERGGSATRSLLAALIRNLSLNWGHPQWDLRDSTFNRTEELLDEGKTVIVNGSMTERVSRNFGRMKFRSIFDYWGARHVRLGLPTHLRFTVDEWSNLGLIGEHQINQLARGPKLGISTILISQSFDTGDPILNRRGAQLIHTWEAFRHSGYEEAMHQSQTMITSCIDPLAVLYTEARKRQVTNWENRTYTSETKSSGKSGENDTKSTSISTQTKRDPYQTTEIDYVDHHLPVHDNHLLGASVLMRIPKQTRLVSSFGDVYIERIPDLEDEPWGFKSIGDRRRIQFYQEMKALPYYAKPSIGDFAERSTAGSEERTRSRSDNSNGSSRSTKKADTRSPATKLSDVLLAEKARNRGRRSGPEDRSN